MKRLQDKTQEVRKVVEIITTYIAYWAVDNGSILHPGSAGSYGQEVHRIQHEELTLDDLPAITNMGYIGYFYI
jgi:hypothetical protein